MVERLTGRGRHRLHDWPRCTTPPCAMAAPIRARNGHPAPSSKTRHPLTTRRVKRQLTYLCRHLDPPMAETSSLGLRKSLAGTRRRRHTKFHRRQGPVSRPRKTVRPPISSSTPEMTAAGPSFRRVRAGTPLKTPPPCAPCSKATTGAYRDAVILNAAADALMVAERVTKTAKTAWPMARILHRQRRRQSPHLSPARHNARIRDDS